jgi:DNA-directed RNA polymerase specialized sigma24 family protein
VKASGPTNDAGDQETGVDRERIEAVRTQTARLCAEFEAEPPATRLAGLVQLRQALEEVTWPALRAAIAAARGDGWALRGIAEVVGCSHEQVRQMLGSAQQPPPQKAISPHHRPSADTDQRQHS